MTTSSTDRELRSEDALFTDISSSSSLAREHRHKHSITIAATFTAEPIEESLTYWMQELTIPSTITFAPYNQVFQQLLDPTSLLSLNQQGINILLIRLEDWQRFKTDAEQDESGESNIEQTIYKFAEALQVAAKRSNVPYLVCICPPSPLTSMNKEQRFLLTSLEKQLEDHLTGTSDIYVTRSTEVMSLYQVSSFYDSYGDRVGHIPFTPHFFAALGTLVARKIYALLHIPYKVIVLDCDQTLWQGICGEDGTAGVVVDPIRKRFQEFLIAQQEAGMLLCLCSKNNEQDVLEVFDAHPEMRLKREHLVAWRINWHPKSQNLRSLAEELQLSLESFIFIDDSQLECAEVQANIPEILTLPLPKDINHLPRQLEHMWAFDHLKITAEDKKRTLLYQQQSERRVLQKTALTLDEFLANLDLHVYISPMKESQLGRVAQLTQRTNQFNCTTVRRTASEIQQFCLAANGESGECLVVEVSDRFGDYGLVGVLLFTVAAQRLEVDTFLLSCRVLGRGVEHQVLAKLAEIAHQQGIGLVRIPFTPTAKNAPARKFLESIAIVGKQFSTNEEYFFEFPSSALMNLVYTPFTIQSGVADDGQDKPSVPVAASKNESISHPNDKTKSFLLHIATRLNTVEQVFQAINAQRHQHENGQQPLVLPRTETEKQLAEIWAEVLKLDQVGIHDDFFELGGDSLLAVKVSSRLHAMLQVDVSLQDFFETPTIIQLAEVVEQLNPAVPQSPLSSQSNLVASNDLQHLPEGRREGALELKAVQTKDHTMIAHLIKNDKTQLKQRPAMTQASLTQQRLWFLDQLEPHNVSYNLPIFLRMNISLDVSVLEKSLDALIQRHEILRTTFAAVEGQPMQVIAPSLQIPLPMVDIRNVAEQETEVLRLVTEEVQRPFDLTRGPLLRSLLLKLGAEQHLLMLTIHHIIFDGRSTEVLLQELTSFYTAFSTNQLPQLPDLPVQYVDFASQQQERLQGEKFATQLSYWKQKLAGVPAILEIATDRPRSGSLTFTGATYHVQLPGKLSVGLKALSRQEEGSLYMTLVAAFQTLLHRYTGQTDIVIGSTSAGRAQVEFEALIGFFVNTLVLRTDLTGNPTFREALKRVREVIFEAHAHQEMPFELLVKELQPDRSLNLNPFFQVMLSLNPPLPTLLPGWEATTLTIETGAAKFDLTINVEDRPDGLLCHFEYRTDLFDASTIVRMASHWQTLLEAIVSDPDQPLAHLPLLTEAERHQLLVEWNDTATAYPKEWCLHQLVEAQVERTPDNVAVIFEKEHLTYRELDHKANQLAHHLQQHGVGPDVLVGVCMDRSLEMVVSLLAILKAGGAYVPLDPNYPHERLVYMLQDAQMPILLTQEHLKADLTAPLVICVDTEWEMIEQQPTDSPISGVKPHHLAYMIYTSGSTGKPKGALNTHEGICNRLFWMQDAYQLQVGEGVMQKTPFSFDVSVWEFFWPLLVGARLVVARPDGHRDSAYLTRLIVEQQITTMHFVPSMLRIFLEERDVEKCSSLKRVICSGEALPFELQQDFFARLGAELHNLYGPTEAAVDVTYWQCERNSSRRLVPIGRPIANIDLYILDAFLNPVPIGVPGELYIGGTGLGRGYFNRPELTAERFILHPFSKRPGARLYKTGDLVRYLSDGNIEYLGRLDHQLKIGGVRIELGEIEATLDQHPAVREVVVVAHKNASGDKSLVAYISLQQDQVATVSDLHNYMKAQLPAYMVPSTFVLLPALPLLPNGKVDRHALPKPDANKTMKEGTFVAPRSMVQQQLIQIWEDLLNVRPIGIKDNFFYLGGHSLLATRLVNRIQQVFGKKFTLPMLFTDPTIEQIAHVIQQQDETDTHSSLVMVQTGGAKRPFFYLHGAYRGDGFYCFPLARDLGEEQPFYALDSYQFDGLQVPPTVEEIAATHIEQMRAVQPAGPYLLGGFCNGGIMAYEMARQLVEQGEKVDLLVSIDPSPIGYHKRTRQVIEGVGKLLRLSPARQVNAFLRLRYAYNYLQHMYKYTCIPDYRKLKAELDVQGGDLKEGFIARWNALYELMQFRGANDNQNNKQGQHKGDYLTRLRSGLAALFPDPLYPSDRLLHQDWEGLFFHMISRYKGGSYPGKIAFFFSWSSNKPLRKQWLKVANKDGNDVEVHSIAGTHETWKTEYVHSFAAELRQSINKLDSISPSGQDS